MVWGMDPEITLYMGLPGDISRMQVELWAATKKENWAHFPRGV